MRRSTLVALALFALTLAALALRFWRLGDMPLFGDEAYYLQYVDHPAPAYVDHPAGIAVLLGVSAGLGGRSEIGLRWLNALISAACVPLAYALGRRYVSTEGGLIAAAAVAFGPVFVVTGRVAFPDALHAALMLANLLTLAPLLDGEDEGWRWAFFGLTLALLFNVKLSSAFYVVALALYILIWRRDLLRKRGMWLAAGIAALGLIPVVGWNATHDLAGVRWAALQGNAFGLAPLPVRVRLHHAWLYHTPPMAFLAALGGLGAVLAVWHAVRDRDASKPALLALIGAGMILPVALSNANNPRNMALGLLAWLPLIGLLIGSLRRPWTDLLGATVALLLGWNAVYGIGTAAELLNYRERWSRSIAARSVTHDAADWPLVAAQLDVPPGALAYAVGYSYAAQIQFYSGIPTYTNVPQHHIWGVPDFDALIVVLAGDLPDAAVDAALRRDFAQVSGPETTPLTRKTVRVWQASGLRAPVEKVLEDLDYLRLAGEAWGGVR